MPAGADPVSDMAAARTGIRDTAKWVMAASAAVVTLVVGSGSFSSLGSLDLGGRFDIAVAAAIVAAVCCWSLFSAAVSVLEQRAHVLSEIATSPAFEKARETVDAILAREYPPGIQSVVDLNQVYNALRSDYYGSDAAGKAALRPSLEARISRVNEVTELCVTERLSLRFDALMRRLRLIGPLTVCAIVIFVWAANPAKDSSTLLPKPYVVQIAWSAAQENALVAAGLPRTCMQGGHPTLIATARSEGFRTDLLAYPARLDAGCTPVRVVLSNDGLLTAGD